ncbi:hypothetical protein [Maritalea mobilis]|nr:hypothetical protein [Maritalea mobilis]
MEQQQANLTPRIGTSLPFSICPDLVNQDTAVRLAYSCLPPVVDSGEKLSAVETTYGTIKVPRDFAEVLMWMKLRRKTSSIEISEKFEIELERCVKFVRFGLQNSLFISGLGN